MLMAAGYAVLRRLPRHIRQAINRNSLAILGMSRASIGTEVTWEIQADSNFNFFDDVESEAYVAFYQLDLNTYGAAFVGSDYFEAVNERVHPELFSHTVDEVTRFDRGVYEYVFHRKGVHLTPPLRKTRRQRAAAWIVVTWGLL